MADPVLCGATICYFYRSHLCLMKKHLYLRLLLNSHICLYVLSLRKAGFGKEGCMCTCLSFNEVSFLPYFLDRRGLTLPLVCSKIPCCKQTTPIHRLATT